MLYGMQSLSSDVQEVCLLRLLHCWAAARTAEGSGGGSNMLYGMQGMSSDVPVRSVLGMLPALLGSCKGPLKAQAIRYAVRYAGHE
jgi:hypothetical protein